MSGDVFRMSTSGIRMERVPSEKIEDPLTASASGASNDSDHATPSPVGVRGGARLMRDGG
jgi:hypothetical protein